MSIVAAGGIVAAIWARLAPFFMPAVKYALPWLAPVWGALSGVLGVIRPVILPALAAALVWWAFSTILARPAAPDKIAVDAVRANRLAAENRALKAAVSQRESTIAARDLELKMQQDEIGKLKTNQENARAESVRANPRLDDAVLPADAAWVRQKRRR